MRPRTVLVALGLVLFSFVPQAMMAAQKTGGKTVSVTGCLEKGDQPNEFSINGTDGKKYGLMSTSVDLASHLGHKVTVTGRRQKAAKKEQEKMESKAEEAAHLNVTDLKMVSTTCP